MTAWTFSDEIYSDLHKDAYGFRPSNETYWRWLVMPNEQKQVEWDYMVETLRKNEAQEAEDEKRCIVEFEKTIAQMLADGAASREEAIATLHRLDDTVGDNDFLCYQLGIPYGYLDK